ncbi:MAG: cell division protein FtsL [Tenericutes bacterium]|nr:cell division protein FtsL [Mycoplasmatota bacterium]MDD6388025.1 cell division protein FtsL [Bacilli bacterium]
MKKNKKAVIRFTKGEKLLMSCCLFLLITMLLVQVFCGSLEGNLNMSVEKLKYQIQEQEKKNESLQMQVSELTSYDKIKDIVKEMGLAYNNENIIVVTK